MAQLSTQTLIAPLKVTQPSELEIVSATETIEYITVNYGDLTALDSDYFISQYNFYLKIKQNDINKAFQTLTAEYNPLDNNDVVTETVTLDKRDKTSLTPATAKTSEYNKSFDGGLEETSYTQTINVSDSEAKPDNTLTETFQSESQNGYNSTSKVLERKHGNISAVTNQAIITQEIELRLKASMLDFIDKAVMHGGVYYDNSLL